MTRRVLGSLLLAMLVAATPELLAAERPNMSLVDYLARKKQLSVELRAAQIACGADASDQRDICVVKAIGVDTIAKADLEVAYRSTPRSRFEASEARAQAQFSLVRERCVGVADRTRQACLDDASETRRAALLVAQTQMKADEAARVTAELCADAATTAAQRQACTRETASVARQPARVK